MNCGQNNVFISVESIEKMDAIEHLELFDPLQDTEDGTGDKYYRLNDTVFAEPISINVEQNQGTEGDEELSEYVFIDKVTVQKRSSKKYRKFHIDIEKRSLTCPQQNCGKSFKTQSLLKAHIRKVHCAVRMYVCDVCGVTCSAKYLLVRHMAVHEKKRVECPVCKKLLSVRTSLSVHLRSHANMRPHKCDICLKPFLRRSTMKHHVKYVHGMGDVSCDKCSKRFATRSQRTRHKCEESARSSNVKTTE